MTTKRKMSVPKYLAGVSVVQSEKNSVTVVEVENVPIMPPIEIPDPVDVLTPILSMCSMWSMLVASYSVKDYLTSRGQLKPSFKPREYIGSALVVGDYTRCCSLDTVPVRQAPGEVRLYTCSNLLT